MSSTNSEDKKALSANASSFNPPSSDQLWGAISQSYGIGGSSSGGGGNVNHVNVVESSTGSRPPVASAGNHSQTNNHGGNINSGSHVHNTTNHAAPSSSTHGTPPHGGGDNNNNSLGLWNFGGFGDEAKNRPAPQAGRGGMLDDSNVNLDFMGDHGNKVSNNILFYIMHYTLHNSIMPL